MPMTAFSMNILWSCRIPKFNNNIELHLCAVLFLKTYNNTGAFIILIFKIDLNLERRLLL